MQLAYLCNRAILEYEASDLNPTVAAILHLNPHLISNLLFEYLLNTPSMISNR